MAGMTESLGLGGVDAYLIITGKSGKMKYQNTYGGKGDDRAYAITVTAKGGYMLAGYTTSYGAGNTDAYLIRTDEKGRYLSAGVFGGPGFDSVKSICAADKGFMAAGSSTSYSGQANYDAYIIKADTDGNCVWAKTYGGVHNDILNCVAPDGRGSFVAVGSSFSGKNRLSDIYAVKIDRSGGVVWEKMYGGPFSDAAYSVVPAGNGEMVIAAEAGTTVTSSDLSLMKIAEDGGLVWEKHYGGALVDSPAQIIVTGDGYFLACVTESQGSGMSDIWLVKTDLEGVKLWDRVYGGTQDEYSGGAAMDTDGGVFFAGWTRSFGSGDYDIYMLKLDKNGR
jgi:hypothetical protein